MITAGKTKSSTPMIIAGIAAFAAIAVFALVMLNNARSTSEEEALKAVKENILRTVISCYAYEGFYPPNLEYLEENYKLVLDREKYLIHYSHDPDFPGLMPGITIRKWGAES